MAYDRVLIRDLGSRNGVRVNGRLQEEARLHAGDELAIGPILFRLEEESPEPPANPGSGARPDVVAAPGLPGLPPAAAGRRTTPADSDVDLVPLDDF